MAKRRVRADKLSIIDQVVAKSYLGARKEHGRLASMGIAVASAVVFCKGGRYMTVELNITTEDAADDSGPEDTHGETLR